MSLDIEIQFGVNNAEVMLTIAKLQGKLSNQGLDDFLDQETFPYLKQRARDRFANEGDDAVGQWVPLAASTVKIRQGLNYGGAHPINERTGIMKHQILGSISQTQGVGADGRELVFPQQGLPRAIAEKIKTAQEGKGRPLTPARPIAALSTTDQTDITRDLATYILSGLVGRII